MISVSIAFKRILCYNGAINFFASLFYPHHYLGLEAKRLAEEQQRQEEEEERQAELRLLEAERRMQEEDELFLKVVKYLGFFLFVCFRLFTTYHNKFIVSVYVCVFVCVN